MPDSSKQEIKLFYCYAREDRALRDELEKHLSSLKRLYALRNWHDREILPGQEWEHAIEDSLNTAHLILLLISPDFMNSDYAYGKEMKRALERHEAGTCKVIPIILRPTFLDGAPFNDLQMLPTDAKPITRWSDRDEAFHDVVKQINLVLKDLLLSLKTKKDWLDEGIAYRSQKRYDYALEAFEQALRLDASYLEAYQEKGMTLFELERYDYALEVFEEALRLNPTVNALVIAKGQTLQALKRYDDALTTFEQAIRLDPNLASAYIGRDKALQQLGISREAQEELARQLAQTRQELADSWSRTEEIERQLQQANHDLMEQQKRSKELESLLAQTHAQKDEALEQLDLFRKAQEELEIELQEARKLSMIPKPEMFDAMIQLYNSVQGGRVTDIKVITDLADRFEAIASHPELDQQFDYDAERAAYNLRAHLHALQAAEKRPHTSESEETSELQPLRRVINDNLAGRGEDKVRITPLQVEKLKVIRTLTGHKGDIYSLAISPNGQTLFSGGYDKTIRVWDLSTGKELHTFTGHVNTVYSLAVSPDGRTLISASLDTTIKVWDLSTGKVVRTLSDHTSAIRGLAISPDGKTLVSGGNDSTIKVWDLSTGQEIRSLTSHTAAVWGIVISPDGQTLFSGGFDNTIKIWKLSTGREVRTLLSGHTSGIRDLALSFDRQTLVSGGNDKIIKVWDLTAGQEVRTLSGHDSAVWSIIMSPDGQILFSGGADKTIKVWDLSTGKELRTLTGHNGPIYGGLAISPDGQTLYSGSADKTIKVWGV